MKRRKTKSLRQTQIERSISWPSKHVATDARRIQFKGRRTGRIVINLSTEVKWASAREDTSGLEEVMIGIWRGLFAEESNRSNRTEELAVRQSGTLIYLGSPRKAVVMSEDPAYLPAAQYFAGPIISSSE